MSDEWLVYAVMPPGEYIESYGQCLNCEKGSRMLEARRRKRWGKRRKDENRGAVGAEKEKKWGGGVPLPNRLGGLGERRKLPQWGPEQSPGRKQIWCILWPLKGRW